MKFDFETYLSRIEEIGFVEKVSSYLVYASGLPGVKLEEVVIFEGGELGQVIGLRESTVELLSFSKRPVAVGSHLTRTDRVLEIGVGEEFLGKVVNPLGHLVDPSDPTPPAKETRPLNVAPPNISSRFPIRRPCLTGITLIDLLLPLGKGQREAVIGDKKTGKTRVLLRTLLSQVREGSVGIYALIGKSRLAARDLQLILRDLKIFNQVIIIASFADDPASLIYLTPYTAMTMAEYFRDQGKDVIVLLDDLTVHAKAYRELSLLARRFPGRNAYPGDIFYVQARLLERAGNFKTIKGGEAAITCLPVVETPQGDVTGYITTNIMSMTDGHLLFDHLLFAEGKRPAIDPFLSVTRVGRQTQDSLRREINHTLTTFLKDVERLKRLTSFGAELGEHVKRILAKSEQISALLDQTAVDYIPLNVQILLFGLVWGNLWRDKSEAEIHRSIQKILHLYETREGLRRRIDEFIVSSKNLKDLTRRVGEYDISKEIE